MINNVKKKGKREINVGRPSSERRTNLLYPVWVGEWQHPQASAALSEITNKNVCENQTAAFKSHALPVWKLMSKYSARTQWNLAILSCGFHVNVFVVITILFLQISFSFPRKKAETQGWAVSVDFTGILVKCTKKLLIEPDFW